MINPRKIHHTKDGPDHGRQHNDHIHEGDDTLRQVVVEKQKHKTKQHVKAQVDKTPPAAHQI